MQTSITRSLQRSFITALLCTTAASALGQTGNPRVNQVGYLPNGPKSFTYVNESTVGMSWELRQNGELITSGTTVPVGVDPASGDHVHQLGLTNFTQEGSGYTLHIGNDQSYAFDIQDTAFRGPLYDAIKYFYHNRSGIEIEAQYTGGGNTSYEPDSQWARPAGHLNEGVNQGDYNVPCWSGTCDYSLDVTKGWYDAGDHGKYVVNGGISVWKLLNMYERALYQGNNADDFADGTLNIPESGNGVPDILDEARWQLEFLLAMQVPEGEPQAGMVHHKIHDVGWTGLPLAPHEDSQERALVPPSVTATLNVAATGAQCARLWADIDSGFAQECLTTAERAWDAAQANPDAIYSGDYNNGGGGYGDADPSDEFYWAAAELYITTGDSRYLDTIESYEVERIDFGWPDTELPGLMSLALVPVDHTSSLRTQAQAQVVDIADVHVTTIDSTGYRVPTTEEEYYWGSNNVMANKLFLLGLAYDFTGDDRYARAFGSALDYLFGRNTLSFSFVSGHGENALTEPHHRFWAGALDSAYPWLPPGALAGGPNDGLEDDVSRAALDGCQTEPATCYLDDIEAWSTNEITINWNSALAWVLAFYNDYAGEGEPANSDPVASLQVSTDSGAPPLTVNFDASLSEDPDGDALTYAWDFGDGATDTGVVVGHTYDTIGTYTARLTVSDGRGGSDTAERAISVQASSAPSSSSSSSSSVSSSSSSMSSSSAPQGQQCNWYGTLYPLCEQTDTGWGWENNESCISYSTCSTLQPPYGVVGGEESSSSSSVSSASSQSSSSAPSEALAECEYRVINEWNQGLTGAIVITNLGDSAIDGWSVQWEYNDGSTLSNSWNAQVTGNNPYSASDMGWNSRIPAGDAIEFGFQVNKGSGDAEVPDVTGTLCE